MSLQADPSRVYVGNVNFNATEDELKEFFLDFKVVSVEIPHKTITRGEQTFQKRLGFGFVQFENETDADKAIVEASGKKFKLRQIYAKKALPPATEEEKEKKKELFRAKQAELKAKKREASKKTASKPDVSEQETENAAEEPAKEPSSKNTAQREIKVPEGKKSTDTVFITNLDYKANAKTLTELFKELSPVWINVPTKRLPLHVLKKFTDKKKPIFNKGIAFVKFADEDTQLKAIDEFNGREINGRNIVVEVAIDKPVSPEKSSSESTESPAVGESGESN